MPKLPIKIDSTSNGEFRPLPLPDHLRRANVEARQRLGDHARRTGRSRREFLSSLAGAATTLAVFNQAFAAQGLIGGSFKLFREAEFDDQVAQATLAGNEFIFDVQTHLVDPKGAWRSNAGRGFIETLRAWPQGACGKSDVAECYSGDAFIKEVFLDSDTQLAVLSFVPAPNPFNPLTLEEADRVRLLVERLEGHQRLLLHAMVMPNLPPLAAQLEGMERAVKQWPIVAWKVYTQWAPQGGTGWRLDDPRVGIPFLEKARSLRVPIVCIHKGFPLGRGGYEYSTCADIGRAAKLFPEIRFLIYHSGFDSGRREGAYDPADAGAGIDSLVKSLADNGIPPNANVYAELGSTWRALMRNPTMAAHALGKLLRYVGERNVLWGTDSIWYGSPQDQIVAFRAFEISAALRERHGYPALTPELKRGVFGLNGAAAYGIDVPTQRKRAAADSIGRIKPEYAARPNPTLTTYGPRTAAEFDRFVRLQRDWPG
jgi:predicted TIM-barrel fold metal-dependent hydrolase